MQIVLKQMVHSMSLSRHDVQTILLFNQKQEGLFFQKTKNNQQVAPDTLKLKGGFKD